LGKATRGAAATPRRQQGYGKRREPAYPIGSLEYGSSRGANVGRRTADLFADEEEQPSKRQKLETYETHYNQEVIQIESEDDSPSKHTTSRTIERITSQPQLSRKSSTSDNRRQVSISHAGVSITREFTELDDRLNPRSKNAGRTKPTLSPHSQDELRLPYFSSPKEQEYNISQASMPDNSTEIDELASRSPSQTTKSNIGDYFKPGNKGTQNHEQFRSKNEVSGLKRRRSSSPHVDSVPHTNLKRGKPEQGNKKHRAREREGSSPDILHDTSSCAPAPTSTAIRSLQKRRESRVSASNLTGANNGSVSSNLEEKAKAQRESLNSSFPSKMRVKSLVWHKSDRLEGEYTLDFSSRSKSWVVKEGGEPVKDIRSSRPISFDVIDIKKSIQTTDPCTLELIMHDLPGEKRKVLTITFHSPNDRNAFQRQYKVAESS